VRALLDEPAGARDPHEIRLDLDLGDVEAEPDVQVVPERVDHPR
jgi:hypothetical protein